jgi:hypothetical protein
MLRFAAATLLGSACLVVACGDDSSTSLTGAVPTLLSADPSTFLGSVRCGAELRRYVVTVYDVTNGASPVSSPPTECTRQTSFESPPLVQDDFFVAEIDGYDRDDIIPRMGLEGVRQMVDATTMEIVPPRWTTTCGEGGPLEASTLPDGAQNPIRSPTWLLGSVEVFLHGCLPLRPLETPDASVDAATPDGQPNATSDASQEPSDDATGAGTDDSGESGAGSR